MSHWPPSPESAALIDPSILIWLERLNAVRGVETLQSCSGDHPGAERPPHVWLAGRLSDKLCTTIADLPLVDSVQVLYGRESNPVTEVVFTAAAGFANLTDFLTARKRVHRSKDILH